MKIIIPFWCAAECNNTITFGVVNSTLTLGLPLFWYRDLSPDIPLLWHGNLNPDILLPLYGELSSAIPLPLEVGLQDHDLSRDPAFSVRWPES